MANRIEIPAELAHLIEKREADRRRAAALTANPEAPVADAESDAAAADTAEAPAVERRATPDRRQG